MNDVIQHYDLDHSEFPKPLIGKYSGALLIVAGGRNVWNEVNGLPYPAQVMCVNDIGMYWPGPVKHWYSHAADELAGWYAGRRRAYIREYGNASMLHSYRSGQPKVREWPFPGQGGSGLTAILVALTLGYDDITVAGMPLDDSGHFFDPPKGHSLWGGKQYSDFLNETQDRHIERALPVMRGKVRALSGRLRGILEHA